MPHESVPKTVSGLAKMARRPWIHHGQISPDVSLPTWPKSWTASTAPTAQVQTSFIPLFIIPEYSKWWAIVYPLSPLSFLSAYCLLFGNLIRYNNYKSFNVARRNSVIHPAFFSFFPAPAFFRRLKTKEKAIHKQLYLAMLIQVVVRLILYTDQFVSRKDQTVGSEGTNQEETRGIDNTVRKKNS